MSVIIQFESSRCRGGFRRCEITTFTTSEKTNNV